MRVLICTLVLSSASMAAAQTVSRPTPRPEVTAAGTAWYASRQPLFVLGNYYYPAGAARFFNGDVMVPVAWVDDIPIYQNTTLEPNSVVFVPIGRGQVQPYELLRAGELAGTTGSFTPSFPIDTEAEAAPVIPGEAVIGRTLYRSVVPVPTDRLEFPAPVGTYGVRTRTALEPAAEEPPSYLALQRSGVTRSVAVPQYQAAVWIDYEGSRWFAGEKAVPFDPALFERVGEYHGTPVYRARGDGDAIYLPAANGRVTPYRR